MQVILLSAVAYAALAFLHWRRPKDDNGDERLHKVMSGVYVFLSLVCCFEVFVAMNVDPFPRDVEVLARLCMARPQVARD